MTRSTKIESSSQEEKLIESVKNGCNKAFFDMVGIYKVKVFHFVFYQIEHQQDAEDLTQEVFISLHKSIHRFRNESSLSSFIFGIAQRKIYNFLRSKSRSVRIIYSDENLTENTDDNTCPDNANADYSRQRRFEKALKQMNSEERQLLYLHDKEGFTYKEIGEILNIQIGTVRSRLHNCRKKLLSIFKGYEDEL